MELQTALTNNGDAVSTLVNEIATKSSITYVDNAVANVQSNLQTDINSKASITYVDDQIAGLPAPPSLTGYATESYVDTAIQNVSAPDLTSYATKSYVDTAIIDLSGNYASQAYVNSVIAAIPSTDLSSYATTSSVTTAVADVKAEILGGATTAFDTLNELNTLIQSGDSSLSTALTAQIALKANDNEVVHLTGAETIAGIKTFSNNVVVPSLNGIANTTLAYLDATSSVQTQLNNRALSSNVVDLSTAGQNITGSKNFNNLNYVTRTGENISTVATTSSSYTLNFSTLSSIFNITTPPASNFTLAITNLPLTRDACYSVTILINTATNKVFCNALTTNGTSQTVRYNGGVASVNVTTAVFVLQTFNIFVLNGPGVVAVSSSVARFL